MNDSGTRRFALRASRLAVGNLASQTIALVCLPFISRIYTVDQIGKVAAINAMASIVLSSISLRSEVLIPRVETEDEARSFVALSQRIMAGVVAMFWLVIFVTSTTIWSQPTAVGLSNATGIALILIGSGRFSITTMWLLRQRAYSKLMSAVIINSLLQYCIQVGIGIVHSSQWSLIAGFGLSGLISSALFLPKTRGCMDHQSGLYLLREYRRFLTLSSASSLLTSLNSQAPALIVAALLQPRWIAFLSLTQIGVGGPLSMFSSSLANATYAEWGREGESTYGELMKHLGRLARYTLLAALIILLLAISGSFILADQLLGDSYSSMWKVVAIVGPYVAVQAIVTCFGILPELTMQPRLAVVRDIFRIGVSALGFSIALLSRRALGPIEILLILAGTQVVTSLGYWRISVRAVRTN